MSNQRVEELTTTECRELLAEHHFGRLGFVEQVGILPLIVPVNYLLDDDTVVFRTDRGSKLAAAIHHAPVAFEIDGVDPEHRVGWSVLVRGHAEEVLDDTKCRQLQQTPLRAWTPKEKHRYVCITPSQVIGRRIRIDDVPPNWWG
jgi:nitroimidazol reductase NimA-like FMN-containing flavoprotein (pyridoxamine 5'-phosphate oxidase superfamily)